VAPGEEGGLAPRQQERIATAIDGARTDNGLDVSVLVGDLLLDDMSQFRPACERLHSALGDRAETAVLLVAAPGQRRVEVVTGGGIRRRVPDRVAALAVLSMTTSFTGGDVAGGIVDAIRQIADAAGRRPALPPADHKRAEMADRPDATHGSSSAPALGAGASH
jgi:uncharacterized membrane protein YgcG